MNKQSEEEKEESKRMWDKLETIYDSLGLITYSQQEIEEIAKNALKQYAQDLSEREEFTFKLKPNIDGAISLSSFAFIPKDLIYFINGEELIIKTEIGGTASSKIINSPDYKYSDSKDNGRVEIKLVRRARNGKTEILASIEILKNKENWGIEYNCIIGNKRFSKKDLINKTILSPLRIIDYSNKQTIENDNPSEEEFDAFCKQLITPNEMDELYDSIWRKVAFIPDTKKPSTNRIQEEGDWTKKDRPTNIEFEGKMPSNEIAARAGKVSGNDLESPQKQNS